MTSKPGGVPQLSWYNIMVTLGVVLTAAAGGWTLFQTQLAGIERQFTAADKILIDRIEAVQKMVERVRDTSIHRDEHIENMKRMDGDIAGIQNQLKVIETTRPTTGELQAVATGTARDLAEIKDRLRSLEDNLRRVNLPQNNK
jgi:hypothetical protein